MKQTKETKVPKQRQGSPVEEITSPLSSISNTTASTGVLFSRMLTRAEDISIKMSEVSNQLSELWIEHNSIFDVHKRRTIKAEIEVCNKNHNDFAEDLRVLEIQMEKNRGV